MDKGVVVDAPGKINLHLEVFDRRADGYHEILSLFQAVSLGDTLAVRIIPEGGIRLKGEFDCPDSDTTIVRAARAFLGALKRSDGLEIRVEKRIPAGAGLGGGSSDAAAVLKALNVLFSPGLSVCDLESLGASVGSDVPFFFRGPCAIVAGRGEAVHPVEGRTDYRLVVLFPGFQSGTASAYAALDAFRKDGGQDTVLRKPKGSREGWIEREYKKNPGQWKFRNDFYKALARGSLEYAEPRGALEDAGAEFVGLTGSGSAFLGVFGNSDAAETAARKLNGWEGISGKWQAFYASPLARMPVPRLQY